MTDALREAWTDWVRALSSHSPLLVVLEDVHWFDLPSVRLFDAVLDALADQPLFVLATARPEGCREPARLGARHGPGPA